MRPRLTAAYHSLPWTDRLHLRLLARFKTWPFKNRRKRWQYVINERRNPRRYRALLALRASTIGGLLPLLSIVILQLL
jgi:hypothetical protein